MKKYKVIFEYPNSPYDLDDIIEVEKDGDTIESTQDFTVPIDPRDWPEIFELVS